MNINILILGSMLILVLFDNAKGFLKRMNLGKLMASLIIVLELVLLFVPSIVGEDLIITFYGAVLPFGMALWSLNGIRSKKELKAFGLCFLVSLLGYLIFSGIDYDNYYLMTIKPYVFLAMFLGILIGLFARNEKISFASVFFGFILGNFIKIKLPNNEFLESSILGSNALLCSLLVSFMVSAIVIAIVRGIKIRFAKKELSKGLVEKY